MPSESWVLLTQQMRGYLILILITSRKRTLSRYSQQYLTTWVSNPGQSTHRVDYHRPSLWFTSTNASSCCWFLSQFSKSQTIKLFLKEFYYHFHDSPSVFCWYLIYEIRVTWQKYYIIYPSDRQISAFSQCCHKSIFFLYISIILSRTTFPSYFGIKPYGTLPLPRNFPSLLASAIMASAPILLIFLM